MSPASRGRGLKLLFEFRLNETDRVARFTRAWIETTVPAKRTRLPCVARFTRAWIETYLIYTRYEGGNVARFTRAWIETCKWNKGCPHRLVARFTRAWIETPRGVNAAARGVRRPLHAGVD